MNERLFEPIEKVFRTILDWDLIKKSQAVLIYASVIEIGLFLLQLYYLHHPLINNALLINLFWMWPIFIVINTIFYGWGVYTLKKEGTHYYYTFIVLLYYSIVLMIIPIMIGILNVANGVIFVGSVLISLLLFPRRIVYTVTTVCALIYLVLTVLIIMGYLNYALAFKPHVLIPESLEKTYIAASMFYTAIYAALTIYLFDVSIQSWKEKNLFKEKLSRTDELTDLLNRRGVKEIVDLQMKQARIAVIKDISLILVDIDNFKQINDQFGHAQGDRVLKHVAKVLRNNLRTGDIVGRYGGEEFIMLLTHTSLEYAQILAEVCRETLEEATVVLESGESIYITASFGISSTKKPHFDFSALFEKADQALYRAKNDGKNRVCTELL